MAERISSFAEFWPFYAGEHAHPNCRRLHFIGTTIVIGLVIAAIVGRRYGLLALTPIAGYGFAWVAHFWVEKNRPASFTYPLWSLAADFVMWWKMATLQMDAELAKHRINWKPR